MYYIFLSFYWNTKKRTNLDRGRLKYLFNDDWLIFSFLIKKELRRWERKSMEIFNQHLDVFLSIVRKKCARFLIIVIVRCHVNAQHVLYLFINWFLSPDIALFLIFINSLFLHVRFILVKYNKDIFVSFSFLDVSLALSLSPCFIFFSSLTLA